MRAFIVRPFGTKNGVDFDAVDEKLIQPAARKAGIIATTTAPLMHAGNIREDMFKDLLVADLVIADISIHNANVYYELGIRHALRDRATVLVRSRVKDNEIPFDLRTDRYIVYDNEKPEESVDRLAEALHQTISSSNPDSPVYRLLPDLESHDATAFVPVPRGFQSALEAARREGDLARLGLLGEELSGLDWRTSGRRLVAQAQVRLHDFKGARITWEYVLRRRPEDPEALLKLSTVYKGLGDLGRAQDAVERLLEQKALSQEHLSEGRALLGALHKHRWAQGWRSEKTLTARRRAALTSTFVYDALDAYRAGYLLDLNNYYPGINALALTTIITGLAELEPDAWATRHESPAEAGTALQALDEEWAELAGAVHQALAAHGSTLACRHQTDVWHDMSVADHQLLTGGDPDYVARLYATACDRACAQVVPGQPIFPLHSARQQLQLFADLGLLEEVARPALAALAERTPGDDGQPTSGGAKKKSARKTRADTARTEGGSAYDRLVLVFTGHRVDDPDRETPRFPNNEREIELVRAEIRRTVERLRAKARELHIDDVTGVTGVAGVASGGDILFHQVCRELGIETTLLLAIPTHEYMKASVQPGGEYWVDGFRQLLQDTPAERVRTLGESRQLPSWLADKNTRKDGKQDKPYTVWGRNNLWTLHNALAAGPTALITLIAFWNGQQGDGPGGTEDMIELARRRGVQTIILSPEDVFAKGAAADKGGKAAKGKRKR